MENERSLSTARWIVVGLCLGVAVSVVFPALFYLVFFLPSTWTKAEPLPTVAVLESPAAFVEVRGTILTCELHEQPEIVELPSLERRTFETGLRPWRVSGPNRDGYVLVLHRPRGVGRTLRPWILHLDRSERHDVGLSLKWGWSGACLAPEGTRVAVTEHSSGPKSRPSYTLTLIDPVDPEFSREGPACASEQVAWSPDGETVYYVTRAPLDSLPPGTPQIYIDGLRERAIEEDLVVCAFDLASGETRQLITGRRALPSTTGHTLVVYGVWSEPMVVDLRTGEESPLRMPGAHGDRVHALIDDRFVLYDALPREGLEVRYTWNPSHVQFPKWSIKLASLDTCEAWTVVPHAGNNTIVSYGPP